MEPTSLAELRSLREVYMGNEPKGKQDFWMGYVRVKTTIAIDGYLSKGDQKYRHLSSKVKIIMTFFSEIPYEIPKNA